ncbi:MAG TPA: rRNA maturation RNase YbeY [Vicinamibacterales bacterium]|nr:rRNA maturation RNase YbeY [Vicinamibacterales bacterium]
MAAPGLGAWLRRVAPARARGTVNVALVRDHEIQNLNRTFRGVDKPTDVLSFPAAVGRPFQGRRAVGEPPTLKESAYIGDVAIARGVARRQARAAGHSETTEWRVLALHGLLHLLGYDHENDDGRMQRVERKLRRKGGLREGLIDRSR